MTTQMQVADAIGKVTAAVHAELESGRRSTHLDANDLVEVLPFSNDKRDG